MDHGSKWKINRKRWLLAYFNVDNFHIELNWRQYTKSWQLIWIDWVCDLPLGVCWMYIVVALWSPPFHIDFILPHAGRSSHAHFSIFFFPSLLTSSLSSSLLYLVLAIVSQTVCAPFLIMAYFVCCLLLHYWFARNLL